MKHCAILALGFLAATLVPAALAQDKEAEKLFREMEKKIKGAKALEIVFTYQLEGKTAKGSLLLTNDDKARLRVSGHYYPGVEGNPIFELVSDGKRFKTKGAAIGVATNGVPYIDPEGRERLRQPRPGRRHCERRPGAGPPRPARRPAAAGGDHAAGDGTNAASVGHRGRRLQQG